MGKIRTESEKRALVRDWRCSGLSAKEFGSRRRVSESSLHRWHAALGSAVSSCSDAVPSAVETPSGRFVVVEPSVAETLNAQHPPILLIEVGGLHLRLFGLQVEVGTLHLRLGSRSATSWLAGLRHSLRG